MANFHKNKIYFGDELFNHQDDRVFDKCLFIQTTDNLQGYKKIYSNYGNEKFEIYYKEKEINDCRAK